MEILYIGHYEMGSTSRMRGEYLKDILRPENFTIADINIPLIATTKVFRSIGWRFKIGPLMRNINQHILNAIGSKWNYDLVWVDKGVFVDPGIIKRLKKNSRKLVHFTPDPAFAYHRSKLFFEALPFYDHCVTTKSYEVADYKKNGAKDLITCTQGFDPNLHKPYYPFEDKRGLVFIGHHEKDREKILDKLVQANIPITLAGIGWSDFAFKHKNYSNLEYLGNGIFGEEYAKVISRAQIGLGLLSKIVPEMHTTRTFEIPACGTALVTESNAETSAIFNNDEAIFFDGTEDLTKKMMCAFANHEWLKQITLKGYDKVKGGGYDYRTILEKIVTHISQ